MSRAAARLHAWSTGGLLREHQDRQGQYSEPTPSRPGQQCGRRLPRKLSRLQSDEGTAQLGGDADILAS